MLPDELFQGRWLYAASELRLLVVHESVQLVNRRRPRLNKHLRQPSIGFTPHIPLIDRTAVILWRLTRRQRHEARRHPPDPTNPFESKP